MQICLSLPQGHKLSITAEPRRGNSFTVHVVWTVFLKKNSYRPFSRVRSGSRPLRKKKEKNATLSDANLTVKHNDSRAFDSMQDTFISDEDTHRLTRITHGLYLNASST